MAEPPDVPSTRRKSCGRYIKAKWRCDLRRPTCIRCRKNNWACGYGDEASSRGSPSEQDRLPDLGNGGVSVAPDRHTTLDQNHLNMPGMNGHTALDLGNDEDAGLFNRPPWPSSVTSVIDIPSISAYPAQPDSDTARATLASFFNNPSTTLNLGLDEEVSMAEEIRTIANLPLAWESPQATTFPRDPSNIASSSSKPTPRSLYPEEDISPI